MKSELIIFGRSPFLSTVNIPALLSVYTSIGFNEFGRLFEPDYLFFYDAWYDGFIGSPEVYAPHWFKQGCNKYVPKPSDSPLVGKLQNGMPCLGHRYFTVSVALNWAILQGFKRIYLVGVDHVEQQGRLEHHDGTLGISDVQPEAHKRLKQYVYNCTRHAEIYQTNPAVMDGWELPFRNIEELY